MRQKPVIVNVKGLLRDFFRGMYPGEALVPHYVTNFLCSSGLTSRPKWCGCEGKEGAGAHFH